MMITMAGNFNDGTLLLKFSMEPGGGFLIRKQVWENISKTSLLLVFWEICRNGHWFKKLPFLPRHEYFRRIACNFIGDEVEKGLIPDDDELLKPLIEGISYRNADEYFGFDK